MFSFVEGFLWCGHLQKVFWLPKRISNISKFFCQHISTVIFIAKSFQTSRCCAAAFMANNRRTKYQACAKTELRRKGIQKLQNCYRYFSNGLEPPSGIILDQLVEVVFEVQIKYFAGQEVSTDAQILHISPKPPLLTYFSFGWEMQKEK